MYFDEENDICYSNERWEITVGLIDEFKHVSFVNSIYASRVANM